MKNNIKKGQLSIELIIVLAILLGVVFLVASKMRESATKAAGSIENTTSKTFDLVSQMTDYCENDNECIALGKSFCDTATKTCK